MRVILVGATDGIGLALARASLRRGWAVGVLGRDPVKLESVKRGLRDAHPGCTLTCGELDVTRRAAVAPALDAVVDVLGGVDLLVYCAGLMEEGPEAAASMLDVNVLGAVDVLEWGAGRMTASGGGRLAALGSVAGDRVRKGNPVYGASKAALHEYLEGLRHRLHDEGVGVSTVKPGWVRTRMLGTVPSFPPAVDADRAAELTLQGLARGRDVFYVPAWWGAVSLALRVLPRFVFKRIAPA